MKTKTIIIIAIVAIAVVALYFWNSKQKNEGDNESSDNNDNAGNDMNMNNFDTSAAGLTEEDLVQQEIDTQNKLKALVVASDDYYSNMSEDDKEEYEELLRDYEKYTGKTDGKNFKKQDLENAIEDAKKVDEYWIKICAEREGLVKYSSINLKSSKFNTVAKLGKLDQELNKFHGRATKAGKALYEDFINGTKWYYSAKKDANYFHKDVAYEWNNVNMEELLQLSKDADSRSNPKDLGSDFGVNVRKLVNDTFKAQPATTFPVYPANPKADYGKDGRYKGNKNRKNYTLNGQGISTALNGVNREWFNAREKASGKNYGKQVADLYQGL